MQNCTLLWFDFFLDFFFFLRSFLAAAAASIALVLGAVESLLFVHTVPLLYALPFGAQRCRYELSEVCTDTEVRCTLLT
jgi:hypothetical protein